MSDNAFDIIIIGSGPGGYVTAIRASQLGFRTAIVERNDLGGICLNWGCIPTKALLRSAEIYNYMSRASEYGLSADHLDFDLAQVIERSRGVSTRLNTGVAHLMKKNKVTVLKGEAKLNSDKSVSVTGENEGSYSAKHVILATGARPRILPDLEPDGERIWTYFEALNPGFMPKNLLVIGSGAIGIEFASFYSTMGANVTVVEVMPQILPVEDEEIAKLAHKSFKTQGIDIKTNTSVSKIEKNDDGVTAYFEENGKSEQAKFDAVISAVGVVGNIENLGLEDAGVETERGCIKIDDFGRTNVQGIYAIGDVAGPPMLAHKAEHEGVACVEAIAGVAEHGIDKSRIPGCTYCHPQIASVGMTEKQAKEAGHEIKVGRFPFLANGKAIALGEDDGLVKTIFDKQTGQLLGAHLIGAEVTELIQGFVIAMKLETTEEEMMQTIFPHPTLSEMIHESVLDSEDRVIHM